MVKVLVESVAMRAQEPVDVISSAANVATPAAATAVAVPPSVQVDVIVTVSVELIPVVSTLP